MSTVDIRSATHTASSLTASASRAAASRRSPPIERSPASTVRTVIRVQSHDRHSMPSTAPTGMPASFPRRITSPSSEMREGPAVSSRTRVALVAVTGADVCGHRGPSPEDVEWVREQDRGECARRQRGRDSARAHAFARAQRQAVLSRVVGNRPTACPFSQRSPSSTAARPALGPAAHPRRVTLTVRGQRKTGRTVSKQLARLDRLDPKLLTTVRHQWSGTGRRPDYDRIPLAALSRMCPP